VFAFLNKALRRLTDKEKAIVTPERHKYSTALIEADGLDVCQASRIPDTKLALAHLAEARRSKPSTITHPHNSCTLNSSMSIHYPHRLRARTRVEQPHFPVPTRRR
jgi:hypothetical protein